MFSRQHAILHCCWMTDFVPNRFKHNSPARFNSMPGVRSNVPGHSVGESLRSATEGARASHNGGSDPTVGRRWLWLVGVWQNRARWLISCLCVKRRREFKPIEESIIMLFFWLFGSVAFLYSVVHADRDLAFQSLQYRWCPASELEDTLVLLFCGAKKTTWTFSNFLCFCFAVQKNNLDV